MTKIKRRYELHNKLANTITVNGKQSQYIESTQLFNYSLTSRWVMVSVHQVLLKISIV